MPSERRLHPYSLLFGLGKELRQFLIPGIALLVTARTAGGDWQGWSLLFLAPYGLTVIVRYASFRYRYEEHELVIRTGFIFRNERHIPYARVQNINAVQNVLHRMLGVVDVHLETGGGQEPEAKMSVLPLDALEEMRRRVLGDRRDVPAREGDTVPQSEPPVELLHLSPRELAEAEGLVNLAELLTLLRLRSERLNGN